MSGQKAISAAFFNPQSRAPEPDYLNQLQTFLLHHTHGRNLLYHVSTLGSVWPVFAAAQKKVRDLPNAARYVDLLVDWAKGGPSGPISEARTGIIALPLLLILQIGQYFAFLDSQNLSHAQFLEQVRDGGGIQGCCGGEPPALSIAYAKDEFQVVENAAIFLRIVLGVGAYIEALDDWTTSDPTIIAIRLKYAEQKDELLQLFPETYVSAITEPRSLSFVGSATAIAQLYDFANKHGLPADKMDVTGKAHNPENSNFVPEFLQILTQNSTIFQLPVKNSLQVTVRSNRTAKKLQDDDVIDDMIIMMLADCCDWFKLLCEVANDMEASKRPTHEIVIFGMNDSVPLSPFNRKRLQTRKIMAYPFIMELKHAKQFDHALDGYEFPAAAIAIIGASCRLPGADSLAELWDLISRGADTHEEIPRDRIDLAKSLRATQDSSIRQRKFFGNFLSDAKRFDNHFFSISNKEAASMDPQQRLLLELSYEALESSGILPSQLQGASVGCFIGNSLNEYLENTTSHPSNAYSATGTIRAFLCGRLSHHYSWMGPSEVIDTACSSSLVAVNRACRAIQSGECLMAIAGGVSVLSGANNFLDLGKAGFLSPTGQCKPFDAAADGYCRAEGAGLVFLKSLSDARRAGDQIFGVIPGIATNQGGPSPSLTVPSSVALKAVYQSVLDQAGLHPSHISYVEAHGTGTQAGDPIEMESIRSVMGSSLRSTQISVGSIKGNIGHCESAAGIAGLLKVLAMIKYGKIPPQASHRRLNPKIPGFESDKMEISMNLRTWNVPLRATLVNSYGAAGSNCALLCCEMNPEHIASRTPRNLSNIRPKIPIILSAFSRTSLLSYARTLRSFLTKAPSENTMADIAFTLNEHRDRHRFCLEFSTVDLSALEENLPPVFEFPKQPKPVVLVLSGQYDSKIALSRHIYEAYPVFRHYIDAFDTQVTELGYQTIKETIFQITPVSSAISLQCGIFAVQYACACCWIDSGLRPAAIIGHSLGELVALVVSGKLSLKDCLSLVAKRAMLIDQNWGDERGEMLAIHSDPSKIQQLASQLNAEHNGCSLEIACYNAPTSTVAVGTKASIELAVQLLSTDVKFTGIKYQRLSTTHAFHSRFTEPILSDLELVSQNLTWKTSRVPLETCTPGAECLSYGPDWTPAKHAREPVFFFAAVQRLEKRLGPCVWLEAGFNGPIVAMTRRALSNPSSHYFQPMTSVSGSSKYDCVGEVITNLWRQGVSLSHWAFLEAENPQYNQTWLPPYQFDRHPHWVENVDRAMELQEKISKTALPALIFDEDPLPSKLVFRKNPSIPNTSDCEFSINSRCHRFQELVRGHAVLQQPLCPAPLYLECTTMAVQTIVESLQDQHLTFQNLSFKNPLGMDMSREVELSLVEEISKKSWRFTVRSKLPKSRVVETVHCMGKVSLSQDSSIPVNTRLVKSAIERLQFCDMAEQLLAKRAYGLFTKVMHYAPFFKGISSLKLHENEGIASIKLPADQPGREESTAWHRNDTTLTDCFISVVGLLLNSSNLIGEDEICIAAGIDRIDLSSACQMNTSVEWLVYARYSLDEESQIIGDVFVCSLKLEVVAMMAGVRFAKAKIANMKQALLSTNATLHSGSQESEEVDGTEDGLSKSKSKNIAKSPIIAAPTKDALVNQLKDMISGYTGLANKDIPADTALLQLGFDSLSMIEFTAELLSEFGVEIASLEYAKLTLEGLIARIAKDSPEIYPTRLDAVAEGSVGLSSPVTSPSSELSDVENGFSISLSSSTKSTPSSSTKNPRNRSYQEETIRRDPIECLAQADKYFETAAKKRGYLNYHSDVSPVQNDLTLAYILEAFKNLNVDIASLSPGSVISSISSISKYDKLVERLWNLLSTRGVITNCSGIMIRSRAHVSIASSDEIHQTFTSQFPMYKSEAELMKLAGQNLAACLRGEEDPLKLMFGSLQANQIMANYYSDSPMVSTLTDQLVSYVKLLLQNWIGKRGDVIHILEVGAGTGGTTTRLVESLENVDVPIRYVFTDIAGRMVSRARARFRQHPWISFEVFDLEKEVPEDFRKRFDIVIGTNCVHAMRNREASCRRIRNTLKEEGVVILSEGTEALHWFDICFGLLDGWWLAEDVTHPLQPASRWMEVLDAAGFSSSGFSKGPSHEAVTQQLLVGWKNPLQGPVSLNTTPISAKDQIYEPYKLETMVFKEVSGLQIHADVYIPRSVRPSLMPIALMIHGGGYMTLSRKAIRPAQTKYLISRGFLPVSIDYRLCPEVNMIDGPLNDVKSGYCWARSQLPAKILAEHGILVDGQRIVAIGWSTGGHLAMSLAWTTKDADVPPPNAILSFYAPIDFHSQREPKKTLPILVSNIFA
ncbi:MAG: hypothetical protein Q9201_002480 [Fulgogasparrea decipioides]